MGETPSLQTDKGRRVIESVPVLHPFLIAIYPVLGLYAYNQERALFSAVFRPGLILLAVTLMLWLALGAYFRNSYRAGLATAILVLGFTSGWNVLEYGMASFIPWLSGRPALIYYLAFAFVVAACVLVGLVFPRPAWIDRLRIAVFMLVAAAVCFYLGDLILAPIFERAPAWTMLAYGTVILGGVYFVKHWEGDLRLTTSTLNLFGGILLALSVANIALNRPGGPPADPLPPLALPEAEAAPVGQPPDVWLIALDGYGRSDLLAGLYGHDAIPFITGLEERGFTHVPGSVANYATPIEALTASLNMEYLDALQAEPGPLPMSTLVDWYHQNRANALLRELGYKICASTPPNEMLAPRDNVDVVLKPGRLPSEFETVLLEGTIAARVVQATHYIRNRSLAELRHIASRALVEAKLEQLNELAITPDESPRFVQAFLPVPGAPFLFDEAGNWPESVGVYTYGGRVLFRGGPAEYREGYIRQIAWLNGELLDLIDAIRAHAERPPIILLVSLHGPAGQPGQSPRQQELMVAQRFLNFTAVHLPGDGAVPEDLSPVNALRLALSTITGAEVPLLPNRQYLSTGGDRLLFEAVQ